MADLVAHIDGVVVGWVHHSILSETERAEQIALLRRLVVSALMMLVCSPLLLSVFQPVVALAAGVTGCALTLIVAAVLGASGSRSWAGAAALATASFSGLALAAGSGGASSPFMVWLAALPVACGVLSRNLGWFAASLGAAVAAGFAASRIGVPVPPAPFSLLAVVVPLALSSGYALGRLTASAGKSPAIAKSADAAPRQANDSKIYDRLAGLVTLHDPAGDVVAVHGADAPAYLRRLEQPMGNGFYRQIHVGDRLAFMQAIDDLRGGGERSMVELRMNGSPAAQADGQFVRLRVELAAMRDDAGTLEGILAQSCDLTHEGAYAGPGSTASRRSDDAASARTNALAVVSHELRTPLNAIIGFSDVLANEFFGTLETGRQREYVDLIRQSGNHLLSIVNAMLDMSKIEAGCYDLAPETLDIAECVDRCKAMLSLQAAGKGVLLTTRVSRACTTVEADRRALDQILINLVANAVKFTEKGGVVTIDAEAHGNRTRLSVSDTGIGISAEHLEIVGQPFVQVDGDPLRSREGTGLGLSLVKALTALHGGSFVIRSRVGEGTVVMVELNSAGIPSAGTRPAAMAPAIEFQPRRRVAAIVDERPDTDGCNDAQARTA